MNRNKLKTYAPKARRDFIKAVTDRAAFYGLTKDKIEPITVQGGCGHYRWEAFSEGCGGKAETVGRTDQPGRL